MSPGAAALAGWALAGFAGGFVFEYGDRAWPRLFTRARWFLYGAAAVSVLVSSGAAVPGGWAGAAALLAGAVAGGLAADAVYEARRGRGSGPGPDPGADAEPGGEVRLGGDTTVTVPSHARVEGAGGGIVIDTRLPGEAHRDPPEGGQDSDQADRGEET